MDQKNRLVIAIAVTLLIVAAMFTSFGRSLFTQRTPHVVLPDPVSSSLGQEPGASSSASWEYQQIAVTPQTVQSVIASLDRAPSYYRELTVETYWTSGSSAVSVQSWVDGGWSHSRQVLPSGLVRHDLTGEDTVYYWYEGSAAYRTAPAATDSADLAQRIPTYETVLALDPNTIAETGYERSGEVPCIYVQVLQPETGYATRYWISVESGLLVSAQTSDGDTLVYRMTSHSLVTPCPAEASFTLPDGTVQHTL